MPRPLRFDLPGFRHHVMNRGARKAPIFPDDAARQYFLDLLAELPARFGVRIHAFALVGNHYHLLVECPVGGLSQAIQYLQSRYSRWLNQQHHWDGPVWRDRYRSRVVDDDGYWRHLLAYLHLNPVRAGLAADVDQARWTSHAAYAGTAPAPAWLTVDELRAAYGSVDAYRAYLADLLQRAQDDPELLADRHLWGSVSQVLSDLTPVPSRDLTPDEAWAQLQDVTGLDRDALCAAPRGRRGNPARWLTLWWLQYATSLTQAEAAALVGASPSFASRAVAKVRNRPKQDPPQWAQWADQLQEWLLQKW